MKKMIFIFVFLFATINVFADVDFGESSPCTDSYYSDAWGHQSYQLLKIEINGCECWFLVDYYTRITDPGSPGRSEIQITEIAGLEIVNDACCSTQITKEELWSRAYLQILQINDMNYPQDPTNTNYQYIVKEYQCIDYELLPQEGERDFTVDIGDIANWPSILPPNFPTPDAGGSIVFTLRDRYLHCTGTTCCTQRYDLVFDENGNVTGMEWSDMEEAYQSDDCEFPCVENCDDLQFDVYDPNFEKKSMIRNMNSFDFTILPNPNNGVFQLMFNSDKEIDSEIIITDLLGNKLFKTERKINHGSSIISINESLSTGIYFINIKESNTLIYSKKLIVQ